MAGTVPRAGFRTSVGARPRRRRGDGRSLRRASTLLVALAAVGFGSPVRSDEPAAEVAPSEYRVKAAYLFNFAKFIEWPPGAFADPRSPIVFGIVGEDPFGREIDDTLKGKTIGGRPLEVRRFKEIDEVSGCHLLFVGRSLEERVVEVLAKLKADPVATVSDADDFASRGGIFRFFLKENKVRFEINVEAARSAGLKISAKLLQVAALTREERKE